MRTTTNYCENCGAEYSVQWSGSYDTQPEIPKKYKDSKYCPECKKAIVNALAKINKKSKITFINTNDYSITELINIRNKQEDEHNSKNLSPL